MLGGTSTTASLQPNSTGAKISYINSSLYAENNGTTMSGNLFAGPLSIASSTQAKQKLLEINNSSSRLVCFVDNTGLASCDSVGANSITRAGWAAFWS